MKDAPLAEGEEILWSGGYRQELGIGEVGDLICVWRTVCGVAIVATSRLGISEAVLCDVLIKDPWGSSVLVQKILIASRRQPATLHDRSNSERASYDSNCWMYPLQLEG